MSVNLLLLLVLGGLMWWIGGRTGINTFIVLIINLFIMFTAVILIHWGFSVFWITLSASILISAMNLFAINGYHPATKYAFLSSLIVLLLMLGVIYLAVTTMHLQGLPSEELMEMDMYSLDIGVSFVSVSVSVLIMSLVGAINDVAISIASALSEVKKTSPSISQKLWYQSGITIGKDVLGSTLNTLIFAIVGGQLAVFIWITDLNYSLTALFNSKLIVTEWVSIIISGISIILTIPITTYLMTKQETTDNE
ncbi:YibE/F family protein [Vagococcus vulneris]|uniref:YibE/F n=1 Tax=Vagococcus vulneris TaxID=1977869 RepID=A0A430A089_9ENTE|nr:YibE/F family protein [Vagococcus vulneris]RST99727.1 hypothetical protein CBF37_03090 [Vagococcus vulneris]